VCDPDEQYHVVLPLGKIADQYIQQSYNTSDHTQTKPPKYPAANPQVNVDHIFVHSSSLSDSQFSYHIVLRYTGGVQATTDMAKTAQLRDLPISDYRALGQFRYQIRRFQHFSEAAARAEDLEPQQHQMMLAIRAWEQTDAPTIGDLAAHLLLKHHSAVGLVDRLAERGLVERLRCEGDRRQVRVSLTAEGLAKLKRLSSVHREELRTSGPILVKALDTLLQGLTG